MLVAGALLYRSLLQSRIAGPAAAVAATIPYFLYFPPGEGPVLHPDSVNWSGAAGDCLRDYAHWVRRLAGPLPKERAFVLAWQQSRPGRWEGTLIIDGAPAAGAIRNRLDSLSVPPSRRSAFLGQSIYHLKADGLTPASVAFSEGLLIVGRYPFQVEEAVQALQNEPSSHWIEARPLRRLAAESQGVCYRSPGDGSDPAPWLLHAAAGGGAVGWQESEQRLEVQGVWQMEKPSGFWDGLKAQRPGTPDSLWRFVPDVAATITWWSITAPDAFFRVLPKDGAASRFEQFLRPWWREEGALITFPAPGDSPAGPLFFLARCRDREAAAEALFAYGEQVGVLQQYAYQAFDIQQILEGDLLGPLALPGNPSLRNPFYTFIGDYALFADSKAALESWIDLYTAGGTLATDTAFLAFVAENRKPGPAYFLQRTLPFEPPAKRLYEFGLPTAEWERLGFLGLNFRVEGRRITFSGGGRYRPAGVLAGPTQLWRTALSAPPATPPVPLPLRPGQPPGIGISDSAGYCYLLDHRGDLQWRRRLDGPLLSGLRVLPGRFGRPPLLFGNTEKFLYLIDESGEDYPGFPLSIPGGAAAAAVAVDFEADGNFVFFAPSRRGGVYGYDLNAGPLPGWNPGMPEDTLAFPLRHFQYDNQDFLVALSRRGTQYVMRRDGEMRLPPRAWESRFLSPPDWQLHPRSRRIVATDTSGICRVTGLDGSAFNLAVPAGDRRAVRFRFADVAGDDRKDYIVWEGRTLAVYGYRGNAFERFFSRRFAGAIADVFAVAGPQKERQNIGLRLRSGKLLMLDEAGEPLPAVRLFGSTSYFTADWYGEGGVLLVTGASDGVAAYRLGKVK